MHRALATAGKVAFGSFLVVLAFAAVAVVGASLGKKFGAGSLQTAAPAAVPSPEAAPFEEAAAEEEASLEESSLQVSSLQQQVSPSSDAAPAATPAEVVAARFPAADDASRPPTFSVASVIPGVPGDTFDPAALSGMAAVEPAWPNVEWAPGGATEGPEPGPPDGANSESSKGPAGGPSVRRSSARSPNVLNDAMIASIKRRLRLTAEQEKLWLPVEAALRKLTYTRAAMNPQHGQSGGIAYIDPASPELRELKAAALPLILRLNDGQKREVKDIVHVMGLEAVASDF
jgi:hypothetical protein